MKCPSEKMSYCPKGFKFVDVGWFILDLSDRLKTNLNSFGFQILQEIILNVWSANRLFKERDKHRDMERMWEREVDWKRQLGRSRVCVSAFVLVCMLLVSVSLKIMQLIHADISISGLSCACVLVKVHACLIEWVCVFDWMGVRAGVLLKRKRDSAKRRGGNKHIYVA